MQPAIFNVKTTYYRDSNEVHYFVSKSIGNTETLYSKGRFSSYGLNVKKIRALAYRTGRKIAQIATGEIKK